MLVWNRIDLDPFDDGFVDDSPTIVDEITEEIFIIDDRVPDEIITMFADEHTTIGPAPMPRRKMPAYKII